MAYDADLPTLSDQLEHSPVEETTKEITDFDDFAITFVHIDDPPKVEVSRGHVVEAVNKRELESFLVAFEDEMMYAFYVYDNQIDSYECSIEDGVYTVSEVLLCEDWAVLTLSDLLPQLIPDALCDLLEEMTIVHKTVLDEGELFTRIYGMNQLKKRIVSLKNADSGGLFNPAVETDYSSAE